MPAEQDARDEHDQLDRRAHRRDPDPGHAVEARHPAVPRPRPEVRREVERAADRDDEDAERRLGKLVAELVRMREDARHHVEHDADHDDIRNRAEARPLAERDPPEEDERADHDRRAADVERRLRRNALRKDRPRRVPQARRDKCSFPDPEQADTHEQHAGGRRPWPPLRPHGAPRKPWHGRRRTQVGEELAHAPRIARAEALPHIPVCPSE